MAKLNHIEISREDAIRQYRFQANMNAPKPPSRDRKIPKERKKVLQTGAYYAKIL